MKFVTRENIGVDRVAVPWLIRKFVDTKAEFIFAPEDKVTDVAKKEKALSFDLHGKGDIDHRGNECSFEDAVKRYKISDQAVLEIARIVHSADVTPDRSKSPEAVGFLVIIQGFQLLYAKDNDRLASEFPIYDALYAYYSQKK